MAFAVLEFWGVKLDLRTKHPSVYTVKETLEDYWKWPTSSYYFGLNHPSLKETKTYVTDQYNTNFKSSANNPQEPNNPST